jgi:hypothetical protein
MLVFVLFGLSGLVAVGNLAGVVSATRRRKRGDDRGFSCVPFLSLLLGGAAWLAGPEPLGVWVLAPAALDPATWSLVWLPVCLLLRARQD